mmetsp:Transcript_1269/g.2309  ORF Transcript_1269/g.2309 Transcript_1269/m.2309 type:complete len:393 (-) Transcript_1269:23-1201(-)
MNSVPITDILPWGDSSPPTGGRTILIYDSVESNGRFLLYTIAAQSLRGLQSLSLPSSISHSSSSSSSSTGLKNAPTTATTNTTTTYTASHDGYYHVLWIHCGTKTDAQIFAGMKKNGCDIKSTKHPGETKVHILRSINVPVPEPTTQQTTNRSQQIDYDSPIENFTSSSWDQNHLKSLYQQIKNMTSQWSNYVVILDDVSFMSTYFGGNLTYALIQIVRSMVRKESKSLHKRNSFIILASNDLDQECYTQSTNQQEKNVTGGKKMQYIGAGGKGMLQDAESLNATELGSLYELDEMIWERGLVEIADGVIDVLPLASGFAKDVHGRLVFTCQRGGGLGWRDGDGESKRGGGGGGGRAGGSSGGFATSSNYFSTTLVNYCCTDSGVKAIRLRM